MLTLIDTILPNLMASLLVIETSQQASKAYAPSSARDMLVDSMGIEPNTDALLLAPWYMRARNCI